MTSPANIGQQSMNVLLKTPLANWDDTVMQRVSDALARLLRWLYVYEVSDVLARLLRWLYVYEVSDVLARLSEVT